MTEHVDMGRRRYRITYRDYDGELYEFEWTARSLWQAAFSAARNRRLDARQIHKVEEITP